MNEGQGRDASDVFVDALALAFLATSRWGAEVGYGDPIASRLAWRRDAALWYAVFFQDSSDHPGMMFGLALAKAVAALDPSLRGDFAAGAEELAARVEGQLQANASPERLAEHLKPFAEWRPNLKRYGRQWIARCAGRVMLALLTRETRDGRRGRDPSSDDYALIRRALAGMGLDETDWVPTTPQDGRIRSESLEWWKPRVVDVDGAHGAGPGILPPPEAHRENTALVAQPGHFDQAMAWYEGSVLPFIADQGGWSAETRFGVGPSVFVQEVPYSGQADDARWLLWALADAMLLLTEVRAKSGQDVAALTAQRLPLSRALWSGELGLAVDAILGFGRGNRPPELGDPKYADYVMRRSDVKDKTAAAARRFLKLGTSDPIDDLSSLQFAMAMRAARQQGVPRSAGCGASVVAVMTLGAAAGHLARRRWGSGGG